MQQLRWKLIKANKSQRRKIIRKLMNRKSSRKSKTRLSRRWKDKLKYQYQKIMKSSLRLLNSVLLMSSERQKNKQKRFNNKQLSLNPQSNNKRNQSKKQKNPKLCRLKRKRKNKKLKKKLLKNNSDISKDKSRFLIFGKKLLVLLLLRQFHNQLQSLLRRRRMNLSLSIISLLERMLSLLSLLNKLIPNLSNKKRCK